MLPTALNITLHYIILFRFFFYLVCNFFFFLTKCPDVCVHGEVRGGRGCVCACRRGGGRKRGYR